MRNNRVTITYEISPEDARLGDWRTLRRMIDGGTPMNGSLPISPSAWSGDVTRPMGEGSLFTISVDDVEARDPQNEQADLRHTARAVLHYFGSEQGMEAGQFSRTIISALTLADRDNFAALRRSFPMEAEWVEIIKEVPSGKLALEWALAETIKTEGWLVVNPGTVREAADRMEAGEL